MPKTISLPEDVYLQLKQHKREDESFSDTIKRMMNTDTLQEKNIEALAGSLAEDDEWDGIIEDIYADREKPARLGRED
ncbi:MAG: antitoxin VapB family protein [Candidatus Lokiarchaeota archaeon]|nr:antitoxin VapB family protein [Candidatus Lokiarchaeota archaeon]